MAFQTRERSQAGQTGVPLHQPAESKKGTEATFVLLEVLQSEQDCFQALRDLWSLGYSIFFLFRVKANKSVTLERRGTFNFRDSYKTDANTRVGFN